MMGAIVYPSHKGNFDWELGNILRPSPVGEFLPGYEMLPQL
jgi:type III restriction enzyme